MDDQNLLDVVIIGYGPVGQSLSILLGERGYDVAVFERWPSLYPLPRAVFHDHEIRRLFHAMGIGSEVEAISQPSATYQWFNADWKTLVEIDWSAESISDGPVGYLFNQPSLEALLDRKAKSLPNVSVNQGWEAVELRQLLDCCEVVLQRKVMENGESVPKGETRTVRARYVVGADGANSFVRKSTGIAFDDLGFQEDWLVIDLKPNDGVTLDVPDIGQWCNPARPTTMVPGGPGYRRWEFMRLPHETLEELQRPEKVWELLSPWVGPDQATLVRYAVYTFRSLIAETWRKGRVLLAGDAAHQMPPFMGQGMCSGLRDVWNLAWRFDLVLKGIASADLLDSYTPERRPQVRAVIDASIAMGKVVCISDPEEAAKRDEAYLSGSVPPLPPFPGLTDGLIRADQTSATGGIGGLLSVHGQVRNDGEVMRYDDAIPNGFHVIALDADPEPYLDARSRATLARIGAQTIGITRDERRVVTGRVLFDISGKYNAFFTEHGAKAIIVRPDYYVFGAVESLSELPTLVATLASRLAFASETCSPQNIPDTVVA
ncbi:bifunctional 3-(3-hydroxy-phenyl)propionate/3-hydroxycinnamic acid hydroxylase [Burkholderia multivorans]|uniref:bifunctional 3-(3-hydroxy-phenyl)propionate/3-hydroxycinnamic acid hydroxylase MhpA n=1 Tax=Burkholderia multivorans TaxID=87883 RepID=UPI0002781AF4|nr:bifunctional 3-(3-hydroxy-phenyl)propionate/3-hydroxycinnamic acid hydroxylase [Burkholderia multivorans]EJO59685.1 3-(3-hydroxyphenyl)propionate hydroxylase [Burkholderia multivorans CF2]MBJ9654375.1 bifunctional 3-(3-hydroxy-phenyl)propionate/3-hydroxycinnamic acid hydroxylase [Burkholderia multivorans]MBR8049418.1 bifunctional 3-(3-hydroxy-phenyl)propionate/3-hydroxycinnamic acid hydroxylase [Burkholderia multivorans]MBU9471702.1 bifunctional 3-(3-hydroxy-phenyl)propionate/3-hydroxycinnam